MTGAKNLPLLMFDDYFWSVFSLIIFLLGSVKASGCSNGRLAERPTALFVFGDSIFDAGNNNYIETASRVDFWPYGETFFGYSTGRFTNGRTIPDFISQYAKLPLIPPYLQPGLHDYSYGVNFASGGAGVLPETHQGFVIDLKTQLSNFNNVEKLLRRKLGSEEEARAFFSSAVYLFSIGGNDYFGAAEKNPAFFRSLDSSEKYVGTVIGNLTNVIKEIYNKGGRKFGFLNVSPFDRLPTGLMRCKTESSKPDCTEGLGEVAKLHNDALSRTLRRLADDQLDGFKYSILDFYASFSQRSDNPSKYGFKEVEMACCGSGPYRAVGNCGRNGSNMYYELCDDPSDFLYFDSVHPTEKAYEQLSELFWSGDSDMARPYSLKSLFEMGKESCESVQASCRCPVFLVLFLLLLSTLFLFHFGSDTSNDAT